MKNTKKLSISELKEKAGKAFLDVNSVKGGTMLDCHVDGDSDIDPPIHKTDAV